MLDYVYMCAGAVFMETFFIMFMDVSWGFDEWSLIKLL